MPPSVTLLKDGVARCFLLLNYDVAQGGGQLDQASTLDGLQLTTLKIKYRELPDFVPVPFGTDGLSRIRFRDKTTYEVSGQAAAAAQAAGSLPVDFRQRFIHFLSKGNISSPRTEVLDLVESRCPSRMQICSRTTMAVNLYRDVQLYPGASTQRHLFIQHGLHVNGPVFSNFEGPASLLQATTATGKPAVVKMLSGVIPPGFELQGDWQQQLQPQNTEAVAVRDLLGNRPDELPIAEMQLICLDLTEQHSPMGRLPGRHCALVMPVYTTTLAKLVHVPPAVILAQGRRMQHALQYIHDQGYVHMDVKSDNIFVDMAGSWWLADLGSAVKENQPILSTTLWFAPAKALIGKPAQRHYDWHMLTAALLCELHKDKDAWIDLLVENDHMPISRLAGVVQQLEESDTKTFLASMLQLAHPPAAPEQGPATPASCEEMTRQTQCQSTTSMSVWCSCGAPASVAYDVPM